MGKELIDSAASFIGKGSVNIVKIHKKTGKIVEEFTDHNLIVKIGRIELIKFLIGQSNKSINKMAIGSGGANMNSPFVPIAPTNGDTGLISQKAVIDLVSSTTNFNVTNPQVTFVALFDSDVVNSLVNECALMMNGTTMFARHTFKSVPLEAESGFSLQISWTIEF